MKEEMQIYHKKGKLIFGAAVVVGFVLVFAYCLIDGPSLDSFFRPFREPLVFYPLMACGLAIMLYVLRFAVNSLRHPTPRVILSDDSVVVDGFSGRFSAGWNEFSNYARKEPSTYVLHLKDTQSFIDRQTAGRPRETARVLSKKFGSPFLIEMNLLEADGKAVEAFLAARLEEAQV